MELWIIAYKDNQGKWRAFSKTYRSKIAEKLTDLYKFKPDVEKIQIVKVDR